MAWRGLRDNAFLIAAAGLPLAVVALFLLATAVPRWTVPPPAWDALVRTTSYDGSNPQYLVELDVRDERLHVTFRPATATGYAPRTSLWLFEHRTMAVRQLPLDPPPGLSQADLPRTVILDALEGRKVIDTPQAPDGYEARHPGRRSSGIVGDLFGMGGREPGISLVRGGRVVAIDVPRPDAYYAPEFVGWVADADSR